LPIRTCERCRSRYAFQEHTVDFVHACNSGDPTLDNEDILFIGDFVDYTGSGVFLPKALVRSAPNELQSERPEVNEDIEFETLTRRGNRKTNFRTRQHLAYKRFPKTGE